MRAAAWAHWKGATRIGTVLALVCACWLGYAGRIDGAVGVLTSYFALVVGQWLGTKHTLRIVAQKLGARGLDVERVMGGPAHERPFWAPPKDAP